MQVSVEAGEGLERKLKIHIPTETVEQQVESRLKSMLPRVKIDGFRPGKVPLKVVKQHYGDQVFQEVAGELIQNSFRDALTQENLNPAGDPSISTDGIKQGEPLEFTATFEVYPEVELAPVAGMKLEKITSAVTDADIDNMIETLRKQRSGWTVVERAAADDDRVVIDFKGMVDGEAFDGGSAEDVPVVIGSGAMIPGFEQHLKGLKAGDENSFKVNFPDDYKAEHLAGTEAEFAVVVKTVEESALPEVDEEFARGFGVEDGNVEKLREDIRGNMQRELDNRLRTEIKNAVMEQLIENNPIDVPAAIVQQEAETLQKQTATQLPGSEQAVEAYMDDATRRVKLGLILAEVVKTAAIQPDAEKVRERVESMSKDYEDPDEFVRYYQSNPQLLRGIETLVMEDMVVDWIVDQAEVTETERSFDDLMNAAV
ncbi:MAG: trigger factor [Thiotrichales bacterium]|nr:MAG: trigger factor [Thiotrichales bacterium]